MTPVGIILAGGQSRRMGGEEKSLMSLAGRPPVAWVAKRLGKQVPRLGINANGDAGRFDFLELSVIADSVKGNVGPLAGVLAGMEWADKQADATHIITAATDTPFLPDDLVQRLSAAVQSPLDIAMARSGDRIHPVFALWPVAIQNDLRKFLVEEDKRKILEFANRFTLREVEFSIAPFDPFFNINTPEDLEKAQVIADAINEATE